jgi:hypothetical protein
VHFLAPLYLVGLLAAAIPVAIHLIGRSRARVVPFAAIDFVVRSDRRVARRLKLRRILLLCVRAVAAAAVAMVLAKPYVEAQTDLPAAIGHAQSVVLVLDNSASMGYRLRGERLFDFAKRRARQVLELLGRESQTALVLAAEGEEPIGPGGARPPRSGAPVGELTADRLRLRRALDEAPLSARGTDVPAALRRAAQILAHAPHAERRVILLTDLTAASLVAAEPPWPAGGPELTIVDASGGSPLPNRAVTRIEVEPAAELGGRGVRVTAEIANWAERPAAKVPTALKVGARTVARGFVDLPANGTAAKVFHHTFPKGELHDVTVELDEDALPVDDRRYARVEVRREVRVLLVDGDPRTVRHEDELFYLETALRPGDRADSQLAVAVATADELAQRRLGDFDVIFLCNVKALPRERVGDLEGFVRRGGGLFIAVGDNVEAEAYAATMAPLLPQALRDVRVAALSASARPEGETDAAAGIGERLRAADTRHPMLAVFAGQVEGLRAARFHRYFLLQPEPQTRPVEGERPRNGGGRATVLRFEGGAPALVEAPLGQGRVLLFTSTVDRDWNDLPIRPGFLPLMQQAARHLARSPLREPEPGGIVGRPYAIPLGRGDSRLEVRLPSGQSHLYEAGEIAGRDNLVYLDTEEPGFYRVAVAGSAAGQLRERPTAEFVINVDPRESDLRHVTSAKAQRSLLAATPAKARPGLRRVELWHGVAAALLLLLLGEALLVRRA